MGNRPTHSKINRPFQISLFENKDDNIIELNKTFNVKGNWHKRVLRFSKEEFKNLVELILEFEKMIKK